MAKVERARRAAGPPGWDEARGATVELVSADAVLVEAVLAAAAALGVEVRRGEASAVRGAGLVIVGTDAAPWCAGAPWVERARVCVVGGDAAECARWSVPLRAQVVVLPAQGAALSAVLTDEGVGRARGRGRVLAVVGAVGGAGTSTLAAGLAEVAAGRGHRTALVDLDSGGGGLDLLLGAEQAPGWRWPTLARASGEVGDLAAGGQAGSLVRCRGIDLLSLTRSQPGEPRPLPEPTAISTVLRSLMASHELVVLDCARASAQIERCGLEAAGSVLLLVPGRIAAVAAAREAIGVLGGIGGRTSVVVRGGGGLSPADVAESVGLPLAGTIPDDRALSEVVERGQGPGGGRRWRRSLAELLASAGLGDG